jgi:hypothetical protein
MENSAPIVPEAPVKLWLPGLGDADREVRAVARAVREYDQDLRLQRHELTGDWVVTLGENSHPIYGFGRTLPDPRDVEHILGSRDVKRRGKKILDDLAREAERKRLDQQYRVEEHNGEMAEHFEHAFRKQGKHPTTRVFIPRSL